MKNQSAVLLEIIKCLVFHQNSWYLTGERFDGLTKTAHYRACRKCNKEVVFDKIVWKPVWMWHR